MRERTRNASTRPSKESDPSRESQSRNVDDALAMLRVCVQDCGWTLEALQAEMKIDKSLISRVLNGERPLTLAFLIGLPDDVEALYEQRRAEALGLIVVAPVDEQQAVRNLVSGLLGVLHPRLPARADRMARAALRLEDDEAAS